MRLRVIFTVLTSVLWVLAQGQTVDETQQLARAAYERGDYKMAQSLYSRLLFFRREDPPADFFYQLGQSHYFTGRYDAAVLYFDRCFYAAEQDSVRQMAVFGKVKALMRKGEWDLALVEIYTQDAGSKDSDVAERSRFYEGLIHFAKADFEVAEQNFLTLADDQSDSLAIAEIFDDKGLLQRPNPTTAAILSYALPGAGQQYAGDVKNSLNSLLLNAGLVALFVHTSVQYTILDATVSIMPWFQRYYMGGSAKAKMIAERKRAENRQEALQEVLKVLE